MKISLIDHKGEEIIIERDDFKEVMLYDDNGAFLIGQTFGSAKKFVREESARAGAEFRENHARMMRSKTETV